MNELDENYDLLEQSINDFIDRGKLKTDGIITYFKKNILRI